MDRCLNMESLLKNLKTSKDLDNKGEDVLDILNGEGETILLKDPGIFLDVVGKAYLLLASPIYLRLIQVKNNTLLFLFAVISQLHTDGAFRLSHKFTVYDSHMQ